MIGSFGRVGNSRMSGVDRCVSTDTGHAPVTVTWMPATTPRICCS